MKTQLTATEAKLVREVKEHCKKLAMCIEDAAEVIKIDRVTHEMRKPQQLLNLEMAMNHVAMASVRLEAAIKGEAYLSPVPED